jgi:hypothetical protein
MVTSEPRICISVLVGHATRSGRCRLNGLGPSLWHLGRIPHAIAVLARQLCL